MKITPEELTTMLHLHRKWLHGESGGARADLSGANLYQANLCEAGLFRANLPYFQICPEEGDFIAWKRLQNGVICKLLIPAEAERTSTLGSRKCRAAFVQVLEGAGLAQYRDEVKYIPGQIVTADSYDNDITRECTHGIHFYVTRREAELR